MDFIDPVKKRRHSIRLLVGYVCIGVAIMLATMILLYQSYGYSFGKNGELIQKGLVFMSSNPKPAAIYINGTKSAYETRVRLNLVAGQYTVRLERDGYRPWQRAIGVEGGSVQHFDYPFLFPRTLQPANVATYASLPNLMLQSPDRRWLLVEQIGTVGSFDQYDLNNPEELPKTTVAVPSALLTGSPAKRGLELVSWSTDNRHVLLKHTYGDQKEYILFDRQVPAESVNITRTLGLSTTTVPSFIDNRYDQYFLHDTATSVLSKASLQAPTSTMLIDNVIAFKSYGTNVILYATTENAPANKVAVRLLDNKTTYTIRSLEAGASSYLLDLTQYSHDWYVVAGSSSEDRTYVYRNPQKSLTREPEAPLVPAHHLKVANPTYIDFSDNAQFIMSQNGSNIAIYDAENDKGYAYKAKVDLAPDQHATWMDGHRLTVAAGDKVVVWDYDNANMQILQSAVTGSVPRFDRSYRWQYVLAPGSSSDPKAAGFSLTRTSTLTPADQ